MLWRRDRGDAIHSTDDVIKDEENKRLFTVRQDQRGNMSFVFNKERIDADDINQLCEHVKKFFITETKLEKVSG